MKHFDELLIYMQDKPFDIFTLNETRLDNTVSDSEVKISGYDIVRRDRNRNGGGVAMYIRSNISFINRNDLVPDVLEQICVEIHKPKSKPYTLFRHGIDRLVRKLKCFIPSKSFLSKQTVRINNSLLLGI